MEFKQKIKSFLKNNKLTTKKFAEILDLNYVVFNRNIRNNIASGDFIKALIIKMPEVDPKYFLIENEYILGEEQINIVSEPTPTYKSKTILLIEEIEDRLSELKKIVSRD